MPGSGKRTLEVEGGHKGSEQRGSGVGGGLQHHVAQKGERPVLEKRCPRANVIEDTILTNTGWHNSPTPMVYGE